MSEANETFLNKPTKHSDRVKDYIEAKKIPEPQSRDLVARDLMLERSNRKFLKAKSEKEKAEEESLIDRLTGLYNRRGLEKYLHQIFAFSQRNGQTFSALMLDLDHFKQYNDLFGHPAGDEALEKLAEILRKMVRESDVIARYGGEEFTIILPNTPADKAKILADRLIKVVAQDGSFKHNITLSGGVAVYDPKQVEGAYDSPEELIKRADQALYQAKENGRNQIYYKAKTDLTF